MKLSEFIYNKIGRRFWVSLYREEDIEKWIVDWYESEFNWQGKKKRPPMWLADWRKYDNV